MSDHEIILSYGLFYHATAATNWASISVDGLKPTATGYELTACKRKPLICLSIPKMKYKWVSAISDKCDGADIVILEIPAEAIANRNFALDKTSTELRIQSRRLGTDDFKTLLDAVGDLVCFDAIPADMIRLSETRLREVVPTDTQAVKPPANPTPAEAPPKLLTPLAAARPTATLPEPPESPDKSAVAAQAPKPTATPKVSFVLFDPGAKQVSLSGDFNGWSRTATPMKRDEGGHWETTVALAPGRYEYKFLVGGDWIPDPLARENVWNSHGTLNSVVEVRA